MISTTAPFSSSVPAEGGIARAFAEAGSAVVAVARSGRPLAEWPASHPNIQAVQADATDATVAGSLLDRHEPHVLIVVAGATPLMRALQHQTWETFSVNWHTDVKIAFNWLRESLLSPLRPGSRVIVISSGAALARSPLSGGYAGGAGQALLELAQADTATVAAGSLLTGTGLQTVE